MLRQKRSTYVHRLSFSSLPHEKMPALYLVRYLAPRALAQVEHIDMYLSCFQYVADRAVVIGALRIFLVEGDAPEQDGLGDCCCYQGGHPAGLPLPQFKDIILHFLQKTEARNDCHLSKKKLARQQRGLPTFPGYIRMEPYLPDIFALTKQ
jgi:hypothetical protein